MLSRTTQKSGTSLLSCSRQSLPRPARLYSTPSKRASAPALATASTPVAELPAYMQTASANNWQHDMEGFLRRRTPYTILPTPSTEAEPDEIHQIYFADSATQDLLSVVGACLHNLYDVPRAKGIFEDLRTSDKVVLLDIRMYNSLLGAYLEMAEQKDTIEPETWVEDAWGLFRDIENGQTHVRPTSNTFALMLLAWIRYGPDSPQPYHVRDIRDPAALLRAMIDYQVPATMVVSDRAFRSSAEASEAIQLLSKAAVEMGLSNVVNELGMAESLGRQEVDPLENVPEAIPVKRQKRNWEGIHVTHGEDGSILDIHVDGPIEAAEAEVPFNLDMLRKHLSKVVFARRVLPEDVAARQKLLEESVYDVAVERLRHQTELLEELGLSNKALKTTDLRQLMWEWHEKLKVRLAAEIENVNQQEAKLRESASKRLKDPKRMVGLSPFVCLLTPEKLSLIAILELMHLHGSGGVIDGMKTARALLAVGKAVELEYKAQMCKKHNLAVPTPSRPTSQGFFTSLGYRDLHAQRVAAQRFVEDMEDWTADWTQTVRVKVGSFLVDCLMDVATVMRTTVDKRTGETVTEEQPAFFHSYEYLRGNKLGVIKLNPFIAEKMARDSVRETLHPRHLPMLVKPKQWISHDQGGYIYNRTWAMRFKDSQEQQSYLRRASSLGNLELVYTSLDVLGSTPWKINRSVFDIVLEVWNSGKRWCKIPPAVFDAPEPEKPEFADIEPRARVTYLQRQKQWSIDRANNHSKRCDINYKIEIARTFLGDTIYFPHNVDFRGRAYPLPPHLSHIGDDLSRGLLMFAEAKPLGEQGLRWLKIHVANLYGYDKASFDERVQWTHDHLKDVYDSAEKPLDGQLWWTHADDPWQCLATCFELKAALDSPDPHAYECALPVHQDGTCNGLQHYAALGGDAQGARQVNLDVTDRPSDVYTYVADMVEKTIDRDIESDHKYAKMLKGKVSRKVVKQTVMTTVYGVTFVGAREQIEKQLKDRGDIPIEECWFASSYLAKLVLSCIGDLFKGAKDIQNWLNTCARLIARSLPPERIEHAVAKQEAAILELSRCQKPKRTIRDVSEIARLKKEQMTSVIWTTPLGLPIAQPYRAAKRKQIITSLQTVYIADPSTPTNINPTRQASAFPPNFIHSLDATHMMLTALECQRQGVTFASVHDSYWTHAGSIDDMAKIIRDTFVALHSSNVLGKLYDEFLERYKGYKIPMSGLKHGTTLHKYGIIPEQARTWTFPSPYITRPLTSSITDEAEDATVVSCETADSALDIEEEIFDTQGRPADVSPAARVGRPPSFTTMLERLAGPGPLEYKFVELDSILPPVPQKGDFDVSTIKRSLYFFS